MTATLATCSLAELEDKARAVLRQKLRYGGLTRAYENVWFAFCDRRLSARFAEIMAEETEARNAERRETAERAAALRGGGR